MQFHPDIFWLQFGIIGSINLSKSAKIIYFRIIRRRYSYTFSTLMGLPCSQISFHRGSFSLKPAPSDTSRPTNQPPRGWNCDPQFFTRNLTNERWARQCHAMLSEVRVRINGLVRSFAHFEPTEHLRVHRPFSFGFTRVCTCNPRGVYRPPSRRTPRYISPWWSPTVDSRFRVSGSPPIDPAAASRR